MYIRLIALEISAFLSQLRSDNRRGNESSDFARSTYELPMPKRRSEQLSRSATSCRRAALSRVLHLADTVQHVDLVRVGLAEQTLVVVYLDQHIAFDLRHLIRRLSVGGEDLLELRQDEKAQGLRAFRVDDFDVVRGDMDDIADPYLVDRGGGKRPHEQTEGEKRDE